MDQTVTQPGRNVAGGPRILIDLRWMIPGQSGGLEEVAYCFLEQLLGLTNVGAIYAHGPRQLIDCFRATVPRHVSLRSRDNLASDLNRISRVLTLGRIDGAPRPSDFDVVYALNGRLHPELETIPSLVMISDLQHMARPDLFAAKEREERTKASREVAELARRIVTISDFSRRSIVEHLDIDPETRIDILSRRRSGIRHGALGSRERGGISHAMD